MRQSQKPRDTWQTRSENSKINLGKESARSSSNNWVSWRLREILMVGFDGLYTQRSAEGTAGGILADADAGRKTKGNHAPSL
jgi:hypothetical protein